MTGRRVIINTRFSSHMLDISPILNQPRRSGGGVKPAKNNPNLSPMERRFPGILQPRF